MPKTLPTSEELLSLFKYDVAHGRLLWKKSERPAGRVRSRGYIGVGVGNCEYSAHRIIWKMFYGDEPREIDHIDGNPSNNKLENLRPCSRSQNCANTQKHKDNSSGFKGVTFHSQTGKWRAKIMKNGTEMSLGLHNTPADAHSAYVMAANALFREFARVS